MKKLLTKIIIGILAVVTMLGGLVGCSSSESWKGTTMKSWGEGNIVGGFIGEKGDYIYYINGYGDEYEDNSFGKPVKGALMAALKSDLTVTEVVVPKLFVASDFEAGLYIYGDYVYYGTPNTDKNSEGETANDELTFMRTKLDGTDSKSFFTISNLAVEYRIVEKAGNVYIVYYDGGELALKSYNCTNGNTDIVAKTDGFGDGESLKSYKFADNIGDVVVYYTTTIYDEPYNADKTTERATKDYNKVYGFKAGDDVSAQIAILDGSEKTPNSATYEITLIENGVMYYTETINGVASAYAYGNSQKITNSAVIATSSVFVDDKVYTLTDGVISQTSLYGNYNAVTKNVAIAKSASTLLAVNGDYVYFMDDQLGLSRIKLNDEDANVEKVSQDTILSSWFEIAFIGNNVYYCDTSDTGASYIKYVDVTANVTAEDTDDDGKNDKFYLENHKYLGVITEEDKDLIASAHVSAISNALDENGVLPFKTGADGKLYVQEVLDATVAVNGRTLSEETSALLAKYQKAVEMANLYHLFDGIYYETGKSYHDAYNSAKDAIEAFRASADYTEISGYIGNNPLANYDQAKKLYQAK